MKRSILAASAAWSLCAAGALVFAAASICLAGDVNPFAGTTKIVLSRGEGPKGANVEIVDKAVIDKFLATIVLKKKEPCLCEHLDAAAFTTPAGVVNVSLCDHCFDFGGKTYAMPAGFYELFKAHLAK